MSSMYQQQLLRRCIDNHSREEELDHGIGFVENTWRQDTARIRTTSLFHFPVRVIIF